MKGHKNLRGCTYLTIFALVPMSLHVSHRCWVSDGITDDFFFALIEYDSVAETVISASFTYSSVVATNVEPPLLEVGVAMKFAWPLELGTDFICNTRNILVVKIWRTVTRKIYSFTRYSEWISHISSREKFQEEKLDNNEENSFYQCSTVCTQFRKTKLTASSRIWRR